MTGSTSPDYTAAVAIVGMAGRFPGAHSVRQFWQNLCGGTKSIRFFSDEELLQAGVDPELLGQPNFVKAGTLVEQVDQFDAAFFGYPPREAEVMDPQHRLFLECSWEAFEQAGYDPESYRGLIGVFAGSGYPSYMTNNLTPNPEVIDAVGGLAVAIGNERDSLASTVSYKLNLRGPSVAVQTFCSTSLVAVHFAYQSLITYECDMALAGGVAITFPQGAGYLYQEGGIVSPDGECRTFDAKAKGSVMGNGLGVVVLKRMKEALADGDQIYAVILGSAVNNDGIRRVGYTAPGLQGQTAVILRGMSNAGVKPESISYIEAHGTATPLGDSIELSALIKAFQRGTKKKQFCALGSVKPNVGHLDRASGVTGLIKTAMALHHRQIPPSLNFESPSPDIDLANSPFFVNTRLRDWPSDGRPRRAGVNSFGLGGTNVHVVLEEPPAPTADAPARPLHTLLLSAKSAAALAAMTENLAAHLRANPAQALADVAYTLQVGRAGFNHRRALVARDQAEALEALEGRAPQRLWTQHQTGRDRPVAFVLPGVGEHYPGMARELYQREPAFRDALDQCCDLLQPILGQDLRPLLFPADSTGTTAQPDLKALLGRAPQSGAEAGPLHQTALAQPAVFAVEYALAQLLASWGVQPAALLGYSLGEYVAACLAGVLSLPDALKLVATRAKLIQALPTGVMLAVQLGADALQPYLGQGVELAAINTPTMCVLAGPEESITAVEARLARGEVACRRLATSHAFHTQMLAPAAAELTALARTLMLNPPQTPYLSNVTGTWISAAEATDPAYWAKHMLQTVHFGAGVAALLEHNDPAVLEVGPGAGLTALIRQHPACTRERLAQIIATLPAAHERQDAQASVLGALGKLWLAGVTLDWRTFYGEERRLRVALPTYPFERQRFWVAPPQRAQAALPAPSLPVGKRPDIADWFYRPVWSAAPLASSPAPRGPWLIFADAGGLGQALAARLAGQPVTLVSPGAAFAHSDAGQFVIRPDAPEDYQALLAALDQHGHTPQVVLHLWSLDAPQSVGPAVFEATRQRGFDSVIGLAGALGAQLRDTPVPLLLVTRGLQATDASELPQAEQATLVGLRAVLGQEYPTLRVRLLDLPAQADPASFAERLLAEAGAADDLVAWRGDTRLVQSFVPQRLEAPSPSRLREGGVYLITGGLGGVALLLAEHLARAYRAKLALVGRSSLPARAEWPAWLAAHPEDDRTSARIRRVQALEAAGAEVLLLQADVADPAPLAAAVQAAEARFGSIHGVLHAAGVSEAAAFGVIGSMTAAQREAHFLPKVYGLYALEQALGARALDFCLLFSSLSAVLGGLGFGAYAAANSFMDAFAQRHTRLHGRPWISVNWDTWHLKAGQHDVIGATVAQYEMFPPEGAAAFERVITTDASTPLVNSTGDLEARIRQWLRLESLQAAADEPVLPPPAAGLAGDYEDRIAAIWQQVLGVEQVGLHDNFFDLGGNSLTSLQVIAKLKKEFKVQVPAVALFEAPTVSALAQYLRPSLPQAADPLQEKLTRRRTAARQTNGAQDIAIVAMHGRFPGANTVEQFWHNLRGGVESLTHFSDQQLLQAGVDPQLVKHPGYVKCRPVLDDVTHFDAAFFGYTPREAELMDPQQRLFHECVWEALELAGYDTQRFPGLVGTFGGSNINMYLMRMVGDPELLPLITDNTILENDKDALTTNVSYKLNLRGPSFAVQTFCSTSLVATHLACRSLQSGECDLAVAGGVSVRVPVASGYLYQEGDQVSPDGHVRTFDARGEGATFGDGVAVVVLKRLADALEDGDTIHAVIKGSAINNDGGLKVGYTAPSVVGQSDVVVTALERAGIDPTTIGYVEAHGTATRLGDPIEVASLTRAYRQFTDRTGFCLIGSVKPNVGHLDRAAGVTGLIKAVQAVKHGVVPATLHFERPNPEIDFDNSPFVVSTALQPWPALSGPRRAAVNSLGVGGTNAHVIVEQAPEQPASGPSRPQHLLLLSAKTPSALEAATARLRDALEAQPELNLADVAHTLQVGRRVFEHRRALVVRDRAEALALLAGQQPARLWTAAQKPTTRTVAFVLPGVGEHYPGMARELYEREPAFKAALDQCCDRLLPILGQDLRPLLFPAEANGSASNGNGSLKALLGRGPQAGAEAGPLHQTALAQPAVFAVEYALARLLASWGIQPAALLGYSLGEYVAACLAGVLGLDDALKLVATRAKLIQNLPHGVMLAVQLGAEALQPYLGDGVELAAVNTPAMCVLAGPEAAIAAVEARLAQDEVACRRLATSHAFHTQMLAPAAAELTALASSLTLHAPRVPYLSNVSGTWITEAEASDPAYWARHMLQTVRFAEGVTALFGQGDPAVLEVGPGAGLTALIRQHPACGRERLAQVVPTLPAAHEHQDAQASVLGALGKLWLLDVPVNWNGFSAGERRRRVQLPTYPFERQHFWIEPRRPGQAALDAAGKKADLADWFYLPVWEPAALPAPPAEPATWLVLCHPHGLGAQLAERLAAAGHSVVRVEPGPAFAQHGPQRYRLRPDQRADYEALLRGLAQQGHTPTRVAHLWSGPDAPAAPASPEGFRQAQALGFYSLLALTQALGAQDLDQPTRIVVLSAGVQPAGPADTPAAEQAPLVGLCKVISQEQLMLQCRSVDLEAAGTPDEALLAALLDELRANPVEPVVAYRSGVRLAQTFRPERLESAAGAPLRDGGVYLITGGLGGIGLVLAEHLARTRRAKLALLGRSGLPARDTWDTWLATHAEDDRTSARIRKVQALEQAGAEVLTLAADVADPAQLSAAIQATEAHFGTLHGLLHAAGNVDPSGFALTQELSVAQCESHFGPKVYGLYTLEQALAGRALDFCTLFSSVSSVLGGLGYGPYTASNFFMDIFARRHNRAGAPAWKIVNWDTWGLKEGQHDVIGATVAQFEMSPREGAEAFERTLAHPAEQIVNSTGDLAARIRQWVLLESLQERSSRPLTTHARPALATAFVAPSGDYEARIAAIWQQVLGIEQIGIDDNFYDLGGNSLISLQVVAALKKEFKVQVPAVALFEAPSVRLLAQYLRPSLPQAADPLQDKLTRRRSAARQTNAAQDIAIVAMHGRFPGADSVEQFWDNLRAGVESFSEFSDQELTEAGVEPLLIYDPNYVRRRPILHDIDLFDAAFFGYTPREAELMDPQQRLFHECVWEALEQAGYDTQRFPGLIGLFGGTNLSTYLMRLTNDPVFQSIANESAIFENDKDGLTTNISYRLNLKGPSFAVQTFCSTSLVATHLACRSLQNGESDMAVAGGVSLRVPVKMGYLYREGGQEAPDGRVRTFDAKAKGAVWADGVGVVVLKRLADALEDGDTIHAVIKGSAINNDGGLKVGYTAPSVIGQSDVVVTALERAGIDPTTIGYVEAHGTATPLGDPIEVASLTRAYRQFTDRTGFCLIGSVKPNIGHLDRAAGVTGLIKAVQVVKHGQVPPTLHFEQPNPEIDFDNSPFVVSRVLQPWPMLHGPRRAAVNSLGVGGTNAHMIVEQAPEPVPSGPSRPHQLLLLSAKTPSALEAATARLREALETRPELNLADVAHTLQVGRRVFEHRRALVVRDRAEALVLLAGEQPSRVWTAAQKPSTRTVAFVLPGVGEHYPGMARELYEREPAFKTALDQCCDRLLPILGQDLRPLLFPPASEPAGNGNGSLKALLGRAPQAGAEAGPLHQTALAQPAVFAVEYALAQLLASWGVHPAGLLGYSLGEYVAACLAGVLSLPDALTLVATRAKLIQNLPSGLMLAVQLGADALQPYLGDGVELAVVNTPAMCVLAGPEAAIAAVEARLAQAEVACRRLATSHAFHSQMLAPAAAELTALAATLTLNPPRVPYLSNVSGTWITEAETSDPAYWAKHMVQTVRFNEGVTALLAQGDPAVLEVGPGAGLTALVRQHPACGRERLAQVVPTLPAAHERQDAQASVLGALGKLWLLDVPVSWGDFSSGEQRRRVPLPTYPFERQRFWIEPQQHSGPRQGLLTRRPNMDEWFAAPSWKLLSPVSGGRVREALATRQRWLLLLDEQGLGAALARALADHDQEVITVVPGAAFAQQDTGSYTLRPHIRADYDQLLQEIGRHGQLPGQIVHLWGLSDTSSPAADAPAQIERGFSSLLALTQALGDQNIEHCRISVVADGLYDVTGAETLDPLKATLIGPCKIIPQEYPNLTSRAIDVVLPPGGPAGLVALLRAELAAGGAEEIVALRGGRRWAQTFEPAPLACPPEQTPLRQHGVYLLTGGLGGIALGLAEHLARTQQARLALLNRTGLPARADWDAWLAAHPEDDRTSARIRKVQALEAAGAEVLLLQADVARPEQVHAAVQQTLAHFGALHGVLHTAGVPGVGLMQLKTAEAAAGVLAPKVYGTLALAQALADVPLDFLALFSSVTSATGGGPGQADYCAANAFLDAFARANSQRFGRTVSISWGEWQWDAWQEGLLGFPEDVRAMLRASRRAYGLTFDEGQEALRRVLLSDLPHVFVTTQDLRGMVEHSRNSSAAVVFQQMQEQRQARPLYPRPTLGTSFVAPSSPLEQQIAAIWSDILGIEQIGVDDNFFELGGNSLLGVDLITRLRKALKIEKLQTYVLYEAPSVGSMAAYVTRSQQETQEEASVVKSLEDRAEKRRENLKQFRRRP